MRNLEESPAPGVGRHLERSEIVFGLPRAAGRIACAGEQVDVVGRVWGDTVVVITTGKFWKSFGPCRG
jgi:hypothetical protein